jgi:hypothetical protein
VENDPCQQSCLRTGQFGSLSGSCCIASFITGKYSCLLRRLIWYANLSLPMGLCGSDRCYGSTPRSCRMIIYCWDQEHHQSGRHFEYRPSVMKVLNESGSRRTKSISTHWGARARSNSIGHGAIVGASMGYKNVEMLMHDVSADQRGFCMAWP